MNSSKKSLAAVWRTAVTAGCIALACASAPALAIPTTTFTITGGGITGTLNGTAFTNATWTVSAQVDTSTQTTASNPPVDLYKADAPSPSLTVTFGGTTLSATLTSPNWRVWSASIFGAQSYLAIADEVTPDAPMGGFMFNFVDTSFYVDFQTLVTPASFSTQTGGFDTGTYDTNLGSGTFIITGSNADPAAFCVGIPANQCIVPGAGVPVPGTLALLIASGLGLLSVRRRSA
jgi:hypothetical protein